MLATTPSAPRYHFLDISVDALNLSDLDHLVERGISEKSRVLIGNHNLHSLYLVHHSEAMRSFYKMADYVHADGMSIVWLAKFLGFPLGNAHRTAYMDWLPVMMASAVEHKWRVFYLGSRPDVLDTGLERLRSQWPGLQIEGRHGYFEKSANSADNAEVLSQIARYQPDLLLVGMGMPIQEEWIAANLSQIKAGAIVVCGALMDYIAGAIPTPPRWLGPVGLEWAFRLVAEPRRLARRYLIEPWSVLGLLRNYRPSQDVNLMSSEALSQRANPR